MNETTQLQKPSANHTPAKPKVEREAQHPSDFTATVDATGPAPDELLSLAPSSVLSHEPSALLQTYTVSRSVGSVRPAAWPSFGGKNFAGVPTHSARPTAVQPKLTVGAAHDPSEEEADQVAEQVMRMFAPVSAAPGGGADASEPDGNSIQRAPEEDEIQTKPLAATIRPFVQRATPKAEEDELQTKRVSAADSFDAGDDFENRLSATSSGGNPLPAEVRTFMEPRFGADFSGVRLHAGDEAAELNRSVSARAFTLGRDIYLGEGQMEVASDGGKRLLAHELTHVVQQGGAGMLQQAVAQPKRVAGGAGNQSKSAKAIQREISTPLKKGVKVKKGIAQLEVKNVTFILKEDTRSKSMEEGKGNTTVTPVISYGRYSASKDDKVTKFSSPKIKLIIQTVYGPGVTSQSPSIYGKGTEEDTQKGKGSLGYHEGSHGTDFINYIKKNPLPSFEGRIGMRSAEFKQAAEAYTKQVDIYVQEMRNSSISSTDCVGKKAPLCSKKNEIKRSVQRAIPQSEDEAVQRAAEEEDELQTKRASAADSFEVGRDFENRVAGSSGGSPLPDETRTFMEPRFGMDFSGVRLHAGGEAADLNRSVSARAFTLGRDIYLGAGQTDVASDGGKRLLAHELTHVVQQNGGGVIRRELAVQIQPAAGGKIGSVEIVGRPEGYWSDTMGDHTTAFAVHAEGIRTQLKGKSLAEAVGVMQTLIEEAKKLPGVGLVKNLEADKKQTYDAALDKLNDAPTDAPQLQSYINAYLQFRELIPGSTIKTKLKTGYFGKGKGESEPVEKLVRYESGGGGQAQDVLEAVKKLFDYTGVGMMAVEMTPQLVKEMSPGMDTALAPEGRVQKIWEQHLASIKMSFPKSYQAVEDQLKTVQVLPMMKDQVKRDIEQDKHEISACVSRAARARDDIDSLLPRQRKPEYLSAKYSRADYRRFTDTLTAALAEGEEWLQRGASQFELLKKIDPLTDVRFDAVGFTQQLANAKNPLNVPLPPRTRTPRQLYRPGEQETKSASQKRPHAEASLPTEPSAKRRKTDLAAPKQSMAIQILLKNDGTIAEMKAGGRPPSPFSGTMGAHTTAWIVHLDHVRRYILGKTVANAIQAVTDELVPDARDIYKDIGEAEDIEPEHQNRLTEAGEALENSADAAEGQDSPLFLQQYIQHLLTYINFIPNATLNKVDTTGHGEAAPRKTLLEHEQKENADPRDLRKAIAQLFDADEEGPLWNNHLRIISRTYPKAFKKSGYEVSEPVEED
jgi:hypothetical protein